MIPPKPCNKPHNEMTTLVGDFVMYALSRRQLLQSAAALGLSSVITPSRQSLADMWSQTFTESKRDISPITPNDEFYITSYRTSPFILAEDWTLTIKGLVKSPFSLTYSQLLTQPTQSDVVTLECVGNRVAGEAIGTAEWEGASLKTLLDQAGINSQAYDVVLRAADGYSDNFPVERAMIGDVLITR